MAWKSARRDAIHGGEVRAITAWVSREEAQPGYGRMRTDVEVGKRRAPSATSPLVGEEGLSREKGRFVRERKAAKFFLTEELLQLFDRREPDR